WHALHAPDGALEATKKEVAERLGGSPTERRVTRTALAQDLDTGVGRVLEALDELGLAKSTYVIYTSDNGAGGGSRARGARRRRGGRQRESGLGGGKGSLGEGGIRVPFIIRGPGIAAGSWHHTPSTGLDFHPTFAHWAGARDLPKTIEGGNFAPLLTGAKDAQVERARPGLTFHFPHYQNDATPQSAIRLGALKLVRTYEDGKEVLYDLDADPQETTDLASKRPDDAKALATRLDDWLQAVQAQLPTKNAHYDPDNPPEAPRRGGRGSKGGRKGRRHDR
ncbi:MAG: sulfatase-like hydrolase/transferase, partial [Planctomycetota bacterium]|nr:sulfatase-like hydrolase/transferase [Planctomycetota bacterium]